MPTVNGPATTVNAIISGVIFGIELKAIQAAMVADQPWLGFPIISQLFTMLLNKIGSYEYKKAATAATFAIIDAQVGAEKTNYIAAEGALRAAHQSGDPNVLAKATSDFEAAAAAVIHWDGSASI